MAESDWDNDFDAVLDATVEQIEAALPAALAKGAEHLRAEAVKLVPIETGNLAGSAEVRAEGLSAQVYFPGPYPAPEHSTTPSGSSTPTARRSSSSSRPSLRPRRSSRSSPTT